MVRLAQTISRHRHSHQNHCFGPPVARTAIIWHNALLRITGHGRDSRARRTLDAPLSLRLAFVTGHSVFHTIGRPAAARTAIIGHELPGSLRPPNLLTQHITHPPVTEGSPPDRLSGDNTTLVLFELALVTLIHLHHATPSLSRSIQPPKSRLVQFSLSTPYHRGRLETPDTNEVCHRPGDTRLSAHGPRTPLPATQHEHHQSHLPRHLRFRFTDLA